MPDLERLKDHIVTARLALSDLEAGLPDVTDDPAGLREKWGRASKAVAAAWQELGGDEPPDL
jgi:hypothetical protein